MKNRIPRLSATRAAREFSDLLDRISQGAEFVIERHSEPVAQIGPVLRIPRKISECIAVGGRGRSARPDPDFGRDLVEVIEAAVAEEPPKWESS